jgi:hypothetical protein
MLAATLSAFGIASSANADALYFEKAAVKTASETTCLRFAADTARNLAFQNGHQNAAEVAGVKNGVYVSITCIGRGQQNAIAVVMAVAPNFGLAQQVGHLVADKVKGVICFDSPC